MSLSLRISLRRAQLCSQHSSFSHLHQQTRNATLIRRPKRPYTFTQLVMLTDGSAFVHRTTSPVPVYRSNKDMFNVALWNPSSDKLLNVEEDEAGKLSAFRSRFGRNWDSASRPAESETQQTATDGTNKADAAAQSTATETKGDDSQGLDHLMDLISDSAKDLPVLKGTIQREKRKK